MRDAPGNARPRDRARRRLQHRRRDVETEEPRVRIAPRRENEIAPRAAADLEHRAAGGRREPVEHAVAPEQIELARRIVDVPLRAVDGIHRARRHRRRAGHAIGPQPAST